MGKKTLPLLALIIGIVVMVTAMNQSFINKIKHEKYFAHLNPSEKKKGTSFTKPYSWNPTGGGTAIFTGFVTCPITNSRSNHLKSISIRQTGNPLTGSYIS